MMKLVLLLSLFTLSFSSFSKSSEKSFTFSKEKNKLQVMTSLVTQSSTITTEGSDTSVAANADFSVTGQKIQGEYFLNENYSIIGSYYFGLIIDIDAEIQGFDLGAQYYPMGNGATKNVSILGSELTSSPEWAPYLSLSASTRDIQFSSVNLKFQGLDAAGGTYWHFKDDYYMKGNVFFQQHINNNIRTLTTTGAGIGIGMKF